MGPELSLFLISAATAGSTLALGLPIARRCRLAPGEALVATMALGLIAVFISGWLVYVFGLPLTFLWLVPVAAPLALTVESRALVTGWRDVTAREIALGTGLVACACVAWLATVASYSGGGWAADWYEHWERAQFFLERGPLDTKFIGRYALTARPPFANVVTGAFLHVTRNDFAHYQLFTTLLGCLAFAPAALLAARWGRPPAIRGLVVFVMVSPMFIQNATFAWTKLPAAFFVLTALYFFLRAHDNDAPRAAGPLCAACFAAGILTHYSAAPYAVLLVAAWFVRGWKSRHETAWRRTTARMIVLGTALLATWFGWSLANLGVRGTLFTNSTVTSADAQHGNQLVKVALNLIDTLVPHFLRPLDRSLIWQTSPWGAWRDAFFQCYQVNLLLACGSLAWLVIARELAAASHAVTPTTRAWWTAFIAGSVLLGVAAHGQRDHWGLAHICLQPLILLGLAFLAARWTHLGRGWRLVLIIGATIDVVAGIALQFGVESFALDRWFGGQRSAAQIFESYNESAVMNLRAKVAHQLAFFSDVLGAPFIGPALLAAGLLALAVIRARREPRPLPDVAEFPPCASARSSRLLLVSALAAILLGAMHLWTAWCVFPVSSWNESRLAAAFALRFGSTLYPLVDGGPLTTWTYGPLGALLNLPATFAPSVVGAIEIAGVINVLTLVVPLLIVCAGDPELRRQGWAARVLAFAVLVVLLPTDNLIYHVADHAAIASGLLSCWLLSRERVPARGCLVAAAVCCALSISAKQLSVLLPLGQLYYLSQHASPRVTRHYAVWLFGVGVATCALNIGVFGLRNLWLNLVQVPGAWPWGEIETKLSLHWAWMSVYVVLPFVLFCFVSKTRIPLRSDDPTHRFLLCSASAAVALLPLGLLALFKVGGATNVVHTWYYLMPGLVVFAVRNAGTQLATSRAIAGAILFVGLIRAGQFSVLPTAPATAHLVQAEQIARTGGGTQWFPLNPLVTFYSDRRLYHDEDGIMGRSGAKLAQPPAMLRQHLPSPLRAIVLPTQQPQSVALWIFPEFNQREAADYWVIYRRPSFAPSVTSTH